MPLSSFTQVPAIAENSAASPGLWNNIYSIISQNVDQLNSDTSQGVRNSQLSTNTIGAASGNTVRLVNGQDWIAESVDSGGATFNAKAFGAIADRSTSGTSAVQAAMVAANTRGGGVIYIPSGVSWNYPALRSVHSNEVQLWDDSGVDWDNAHAFTAQRKWIMRTEDPGTKNAHEAKFVSNWHPAVIIDNDSNATTGEILNENPKDMASLVYRQDGVTRWILGKYPGTAGEFLETFRLSSRTLSGGEQPVFVSSLAGHCAFNWGSPPPLADFTAKSIATNRSNGIFHWYSNSSLRGVAVQYLYNDGSGTSLLWDERILTTRDKRWLSVSGALLASLDSQGEFRASSLTLSGAARLGGVLSMPPNAPAAGDSAGTTGDITWGVGSGTTFLYVCTSTNSWHRVVLNPF